MHQIVEELVTLIEKNGWQKKFDDAIALAAAQQVPDIADIKTLKDWLRYIDDLVEWAPLERKNDRAAKEDNCYDHIMRFYFFLQQPSLRELQSPIAPGKVPEKLTPLSEWIVKYATAWGDYLDTTESAKYVKTFKDTVKFNWDEYMPPASSHAGEEDWKAYRTFNQFFARHVKPGMRPIAGLADNSIIVSPADCTFVGWWPISQKSNILTNDTSPEGLIVSKGIQWSIHQLLADSAYADRFKGGVFTHSFLNTTDYHRWHTPVQGKVLESKVIQGQAWLDVTVGEMIIDGKKTKYLNALDGTDYQFVQTRGLVVIDSPIGLVACLPMGMAQVSSVVLTADVGVTLHKGEELGYFQFGGSDFVMVFERSSNVQLIGQPGVHVNQGSWVGSAFPYNR